jgi:DNA repair protein RadC
MVEEAPALAPRLARAGLELAEVEAEGGAHLLITGRTFDHRDKLKAVGGRWSRSRQGWILPADAGLRLAEVLEGATPPGLSDIEPAPWPSRHYHGHRERLRTRFLEAGPDSLADYELLELLLFFSVRRRDTKPLAKELLARFGGLGGVLAADPERLGEVPSFAALVEDPEQRDRSFTVVLLKTVQVLLGRVLREQIKDRPVIGSWNALIDYVRVQMAHEPTEQFRLLFLDRKNLLLRDEVQSRGTVDHTPLYPREVVKRALELGASAIIMVHNHPSGDPTPSRPDIDMTRQVVQALSAVGISVHDHVIVGKNRTLSFRSEKLI